MRWLPGRGRQDLLCHLIHRPTQSGPLPALGSRLLQKQTHVLISYFHPAKPPHLGFQLAIKESSKTPVKYAGNERVADDVEALRLGARSDCAKRFSFYAPGYRLLTKLCSSASPGNGARPERPVDAQVNRLSAAS